jgi:hypothetical protein
VGLFAKPQFLTLQFIPKNKYLATILGGFFFCIFSLSLSLSLSRYREKLLQLLPGQLSAATCVLHDADQ